MTGRFDVGTQVFVDLHSNVVARLHQEPGDGEKRIEVSGHRCRSDKNFHKAFHYVVRLRTCRDRSNAIPRLRSVDTRIQSLIVEFSLAGI